MNRTDPNELIFEHLTNVLDNREPFPVASVRRKRLEFFIEADKALACVEKTLPNSVDREKEIKEYEKLSNTIEETFGKTAIEAVSWLEYWVKTRGTIFGAFNHFPNTNVFDKYSWIILYQLSKISVSADSSELHLIGADLATRLDRLGEWHDDGKASF